MKEALKGIFAVAIAALLSIIFFIAVNELFTISLMDLSLSQLSWMLYAPLVALCVFVSFILRKKQKIFAWAFMISSVIGLAGFHIILISVKFYY